MPRKDRSQESSIWSFKIGISPAPSKIAKLFGELARDFMDFKPALKECVPDVLEGFQRIIGSKGSVIGEPWPGLRDKYYLKRKAKMGWNTAEIHATGGLVSSLRQISLTKRSVSVGTKGLPYAKSVQWGNKNSKAKKRIFVGMDKTAEAACSARLNAYANAMLEQLARRISGEREAA